MAPRESWRSRPPSQQEVKRVRFPTFTTESLSNGLKVYLAPYPRAPLVHLLLVHPGGAQFDPGEKAGLATLTASLLDEGTDRHSALEIAKMMESLGGFLSTDADWDCVSASVEVLSKHLQRGLSLLAEVVSRATYPPSEFDRLHSQHLADLKRRLARPGALAGDALVRAIYGSTPYGSPLPGSAETVSAIQRHDILAYSQRFVHPTGAALILAGDFDLHTAMKRIAEVFGDWSGGQLAIPTDTHPLPRGDRPVYVVDRPSAPQTELRLGHVGVARSHPDFVGLQILNSLLGGKFTSRINLNLRERLGITYGASSSFAHRSGPGPFVVAASVTTTATGQAVGEILAELRRLQEEPVSEQELDDTRSYLIGVFPYTLQRIEGLADRLADLELYGLARDYYDDYLDQVLAIDVSTVQELARRHLQPDRAAVVAVGPAKDLEPQLAALGEVRVETPT